MENTAPLSKITDYLKKETDYALMLTGGFGIGKTHFYKNTLEKEIKKTPLAWNDSKEYKPMYVSLFGMKSVGDLAVYMFVGKYSLFKSLNNPKKSFIAGLITRGITNFKKVQGDQDKYFQGMEKMAVYDDYKDFLICLDDFDRKNESFKNDELFGFVNFLVEKGTKIIIICNQNQMYDGSDKKSKDEYETIKEKVVGVTIEYIPDSQAQIKELIKKYENTNPSYHKFLTGKSDKLQMGLGINGGNIRHVLFFISEFKGLHYMLEKMIQENKCSFLDERKEEKISAIFEFAFMVLVEMKIGNITGKSYNEVLIDRESADLSKLVGGGGFRNQGKGQSISGKYMGSQEHLFPSKSFFSNNAIFPMQNLYLFLTGVGEFDLEELKKDIDYYFPREKDSSDVSLTVPEHEKLYTDLCDTTYSLSLEEEEYEADTRKLIEYLDGGLFGLDRYHSLFALIVRWGNPLGYSMDDLFGLFESAFKSNKDSFEYNQKLVSSHSLDTSNFSSPETSNVYRKLKKSLLEWNEGLVIQKAWLDLNNLKTQLTSDFDVFLENFEKLTSLERIYTPVFIVLDADEFITSIKKSTNRQLVRLFRIVNNRSWGYGNMVDYYKKEIGFLEKIKTPLEQYMETDAPFLKKTTLGFFLNTIEKIIKNG